MQSLFHNAYEVLYRDGKWVPSRFTQAQLKALDDIHEMYGRLGRCTTGVTLQFVTDAEEISFAYELGGFYTSTGGFDVYENGVLCANFPLPAEPCSSRFTYRKQAAGKTLLEIALPYHAQCRLWDFSLGNYEPIPPQPGPFLLFYGDSITQSAYTPTPSLSFPRLLSQLCGGQYLNRGVGSLYFDASVLDPGDTCRPDLVFVEFGANDMVMRDESNNVVFKDGKAEYYTEEKLPWLLSRADAYLEKATQIYPGARICCITVLWSTNEAPQWRRNMQEAFRAGVERICRARGLICIDGRMLTPHLAQCYAADGTHLNALSGALAAQNLYLALNNQNT
ncbi:MAG: SGNH/GDSL hydrolase family protein [Bacteroidales bacterium]|nr:SGNH/GDSL hydrolase family protein [Bacteroidales bacterium]